MFPQSLVKYENPRLIILHKEFLEEAKPKEGASLTVTPETVSEEDAEEHQELLDVLLPPRKHEEGGKMWLQRVSRSPATESEVLNLQDQIDRELSTLGAREIGICPIRREIYSQCFDELIRQEIIVCPERGKLYKRIRNETQMTVDTLRKVYESNIAYGIKKVLSSIKYDQDVRQKYENLMQEHPATLEELNRLEAELKETESKLQEEERVQLENQEQREAKIKEENQFLLQDMKDLLDRDFMDFENE